MAFEKTKDVAKAVASTVSGSVKDIVSTTNMEEAAKKRRERIRQRDGLLKFASSDAVAGTTKQLNTVAGGQLPFQEEIIKRNSAWAKGIKGALKDLPDGRFAIVKNTTNRHIRQFITQSFDILNEWYRDPMTLCCLVKLLAAMGGGSAYQTHNLKGEMSLSDNPADWSVNDLKEGEGQGLKNLLLILRAVIDMMIAITTLRIGGALKISLDFIGMIATLIIGAGIAILNAFLDKMAMEGYGALNKAFSEFSQAHLNATASDTANFAKCWPFDDLMKTTLNFMVDDHGLFGIFKRYTIEWIAKMKAWGDKANNEYAVDIKELENLRKLRALIDAIIRALEQNELCLEMDLNAMGNNSISRINGEETQLDQQWAERFDQAVDRLAPDIDNTDQIQTGSNSSGGSLDQTSPISPKATVGENEGKQMPVRGKAASPTLNETKRLLSQLGFSDQQIETAINNPQNLETDLGCPEASTPAQQELVDKITKVAKDFMRTGRNPFSTIQRS